MPKQPGGIIETMNALIQADDMDGLEHLFQDGDVSYENDWGLRYSSKKGNERIAKWFLDHGARASSHGGDAFRKACSSGFVGIAGLLLSANAEDRHILEGSFGWCLCRAAENDHENIAMLLVAEGAAPFEGDSSTCPVIFAASRNSLRTMEFFLSLPEMLSKEKTQTVSRNLEHALSLAARKGHAEIAGLLLEAGVDDSFAIDSPRGGRKSLDTLEAARSLLEARRLFGKHTGKAPKPLRNTTI